MSLWLFIVLTIIAIIVPALITLSILFPMYLHEVKVEAKGTNNERKKKEKKFSNIGLNATVSRSNQSVYKDSQNKKLNKDLKLSNKLGLKIKKLTQKKIDLMNEAKNKGVTRF